VGCDLLFWPLATRLDQSLGPTLDPSAGDPQSGRRSALSAAPAIANAKHTFSRSHICVLSIAMTGRKACGCFASHSRMIG
jgi:hypothetical protein